MIFKKDVGLDGSYWNTDLKRRTPKRGTKRAWEASQTSKHNYGSEFISLQGNTYSFSSNFTKELKKRDFELTDEQITMIKLFFKNSLTIQKICINKINPKHTLCDQIEAYKCNQKNPDAPIRKFTLKKILKNYEKKLKKLLLEVLSSRSSELNHERELIRLEEVEKKELQRFEKIFDDDNMDSNLSLQSEVCNSQENTSKESRNPLQEIKLNEVRVEKKGKGKKIKKRNEELESSFEKKAKKRKRRNRKYEKESDFHVIEPVKKKKKKNSILLSKIN